MLAFLYSISEAAEGYTEEKTRSAIKALMDLAPKMALVPPAGGDEVEIPVEELVVGDVFIVRPGQSHGDRRRGPGRGVERQPGAGDRRERAGREGARRHASSPARINGEGALEVRATKAFAENTIARIIHMVEEAQERKGAEPALHRALRRALQPGRARGRHPRWRWLLPLLVAGAAGATCDHAGDGLHRRRRALRARHLDPDHAGRRARHGRAEGRAHQGRRLRRGAGEGARRGARQDGHDHARRSPR